MTDPRLTLNALAALRAQNDRDGRRGWKAEIGVDDVALLLDAADALMSRNRPGNVT